MNVSIGVGTHSPGRCGRPVDRLTLNVAVDGETPLPSSAPRSRSIHIRHRRKRKGVQYCMQCNGLPDTAMIHIPLGQISNDLSAQKRTLCRTSYVTPATLGARDLLERGRPWPDPSPRVRSLVRSLSITVIFTAVLRRPRPPLLGITQVILALPPSYPPTPTRCGGPGRRWMM